MNTYFTSDCHVFHKNIIKYTNRPFSSVEEMNEHIAKSWDVIADGDTLYSLGDFAFGKIEKIYGFLERAKSRRFNLIMILGNHDEEIINNRRMLLDSGLVKQILPYKEIKLHNQHIVLFHYGCRVWNRSHHGSWLLFGHSHGSLSPFGKSVDVGVDSPYITGKAEYRPFSFYEIKDFMKNREIEIGDKHEKNRK